MSVLAFVLSISIRVFPPSARLFVPLRGEYFQESRGALMTMWRRRDFAGEAMGKVFESTIHLAQPVWSLRLYLGERRVRADCRITREREKLFAAGSEEVSTREYPVRCGL